MDLPKALDALRPRLIGQDWSAYEGCSPLGVVIRMARLNYLHGGDIQACLGMTIRRKVNLLRLLLQSSDKHEALASTQGFSTPFVEDWPLAAWWPYRNEPVWDCLTTRLRLCPVCARYGYHAALFQMPWIDRCPWHQVRLIDGCQRCGKPLLDGFDQGLSLLQCTCGHDHVHMPCLITGDQATVETRQRTLRKQRSWVKNQQASCWLFWSGLYDPGTSDALQALSAPRGTGRITTPSHLVVDDIVPEAEELRESVAADSGLEQVRFTIAKLPGTWLPALQAIARRAVQMPASGTLTRSELKALGGPLGKASDMEHTEGTRFDLLRLRAFAVGPDTYLHTGVLGGATLSVLGPIADGLGSTPISRADTRDRRGFRLAVQQHPAGRQLVSRVLYRAVTRSYADGCRIILGQADPDLYRNRSTRPVRRFPWIAVTLGHEEIRARIVWTRQINQ